MNILVTGATGFVGSHIIDDLLENNTSKNSIYCTRRYHLSRRDNTSHFEHKVNWIDCDLTDPVATESALKFSNPDIIYHMAAESFVSPSWLQPHRYMSVNYNATVNILESMRKFLPNTKILIPGSGEEYGEVDPIDLPITEITPLKPVNPYAVTKIAQDLISYVYFKSYGVQAIRLRTFNHEGPRREKYFGIASYCYQLARIEAGLQPPILEVGEIHDKRNFTHVKDIVRAYSLALELCNPGESYLVGSEDKSSIATFEEVIHKLLNLTQLQNVEIKKVAKFTRPTAVPYLIGDTSKFRNLTKWTPSINLDELLNDVLNYWRKQIKINPNL